MADNRNGAGNNSGKPTPSAGAVIWDGVKLGLSEAADLASLRMKASSLERKRDSLYTKLGKVTYLRQHPTQDCVRTELIEQANALTNELHDVIDELTDVRLRLKLRRISK